MRRWVIFAVVLADDVAVEKFEGDAFEAFKPIPRLNNCSGL